MTQPAPTPATSGPVPTGSVLTTPLGRARPVMIPWREVARRLADGEKPAAIAAGLGLDEDRIWRHLRKSLRFRTYLQQAIERQRELGDLLLDGAGRGAMLALGRQPEHLDGGLLRCLLDEADRAAEAETPACKDRGKRIARRIEQLGETAAPPPNMAFRRRVAAEWQRMNLQMEVWQAEDAAREAAQGAVPATAAPNASESERSGTNASEAERSETNANEAKRSETNANEHERTAAKPDEPERKLRLRWTPPPKPRHPPIVDQATVGLNSPDLAPPQAQGLPEGRGGVPDS